MGEHSVVGNSGRRTAVPHKMQKLSMASRDCFVTGAPLVVVRLVSSSCAVDTAPPANSLNQTYQEWRLLG